MKFFYDIFFLVFSLFYLPVLLFRRKGHKGFLQKLGAVPEEVKRLERPVWIHAVSVGEAALAGKIAKNIKKKRPEVKIAVSTTTKTGNDMIKKISGGAVDGVFYYPLDLSFIVSAAVKDIDPSAYILIETELWPNLISELERRKIPVILVNGRISDSSFANYKRIGFITSKILKGIISLCMQSDKDAQRVKELGAEDEKIKVTGNIKFDEVITSGGGTFSKESLGFSEEDRIIVAGSTHYPEEKHIIDVFKELKRKEPKLKLILAPRHVERKEAVKIYIEKAKEKCTLLTDILNEKKKEADIVLVDTIGHLKDLYRIATMVFIGGSLVNKGGQNPIEAASWGKAILFGPYMSNFKEVSRVFLENNAAICVENSGELKEKLLYLLDSPAEREKIEANALDVIRKNQGAISRTVEEVEKYLK